MGGVFSLLRVPPFRSCFRTPKTTQQSMRAPLPTHQIRTRKKKNPAGIEEPGNRPTRGRRERPWIWGKLSEGADTPGAVAASRAVTRRVLRLPGDGSRRPPALASCYDYRCSCSQRAIDLPRGRGIHQSRRAGMVESWGNWQREKIPKQGANKRERDELTLSKSMSSRGWTEGPGRPAGGI